MVSRIVRLEAIPVVSPAGSANDLDGTADTIIVKIYDEDGRYGFGEADAPPTVVKSFIDMPTAHLWSRNASEILVGEDPVEIAALWQKLYEGTFWPGRRGLGMHAISAIDIALHDLAGKQLGLPAYKLMGGARRDRLRPYCTIFPGLAQGRSIDVLMKEIFRQFDMALQVGFRAVKMEVLFYDLVTDLELIRLIGEGRRALGDDILLAIDFGYRWHNWHDALFVLQRIADHNIFFAEATLQHDDLAWSCQSCRAECHSNLRRRSRCNALRDPRMADCRQGRCRATQYRAWRRPHRTSSHRRSLRNPRRGSRAAWLEDWHYLRRRTPFPGSVPGCTCLRIHLAARFRQSAAAPTGVPGARRRRWLHGSA